MAIYLSLTMFKPDIIKNSSNAEGILETVEFSKGTLLHLYRKDFVYVI